MDNKHLMEGIGEDTPDSGVEMENFNIVDYILDDGGGGWTDGQDIPSQQSEFSAVGESIQAPGPSTTPVTFTTLPPLRTSTRLEFERQRALQDTRREQIVQESNQPPLPSTPVDLPALSSSPQVAAIPKRLLTVETRLENPTRYHLQQQVKSNISRFVEENSRSVPQPAAFSDMGAFTGRYDLGRLVPNEQQHGSAPPNIFPSPQQKVQVQQQQQQPRAPNQSVSSSLGTSLTSGCSELLEGDSSHLNMFTLNEISELISCHEEDFYPGTPSTSTPFSTPDTPTASSSQPINSATPTLQSPGTVGPPEHKVTKDRQKKDNHNKIERKRRYHINDMITLQGQHLPKPNEPHYEKFQDVKQNKGSLLQASVEYMKILKQENDAYKINEEKSKEKLHQAEQDKKRLLLRIKELENICSCNGIAIPSNNLTWKSQDFDRITSLLNDPIIIKQEQELMDEGTLVTAGCDPMLAPIDDLCLDDMTMGMELS